MNKESFRDKRVGEQIRKELSQSLFRDVKDPRVKTVTITSVKVTKDFSIAKVYYRFFDDCNVEDVQKGLESSSGFLQGLLKKSLRIKKIPILKFFYDEIPDKADKIEELLKEINNHNINENN
jgi:ribosome-binding factor A